jgi:alpha-glucosidase
VWAEHEDILRFWFDRGVGGIRIDSAALLIKDPQLPELPDTDADTDTAPGSPVGGHPHVDRDELHDVYRAWRKVADSYSGTRVLVGEVWLEDSERFAQYLRPDEMHTAFNFDFMSRPWDAAAMRESIDMTLAAHATVGAPATWVLSNHDVTRPVTRYGRVDSSFAFTSKRFGVPTDLGLGTRRARAAALLTAALPGSLYVYQGDELGLPEVEDLPVALIQDPMHARSGGVDPGRDGCRVPLPWSGSAAPFGFSDTGTDGAEAAATWLPQPASWSGLTVQAQEADAGSMLRLYRAALALRRREPALGDGELRWLDSGTPDVLAFARDDIACVVNLGAVDAGLPEHDEVLLASAPLRDARLAPDSAVWLRLPGHVGGGAG